MSKFLVNYFKSDKVFHNLFLDNLETVIETHPNLTQEQKDKLIKPFYEFYEFPKRMHKKTDDVLMPVFKTAQDKFGLLTKIEPLEKETTWGHITY